MWGVDQPSRSFTELVGHTELTLQAAETLKPTDTLFGTRHYLERGIIWNAAFGTRHLERGIWNAAFGTRHLERGIWNAAPGVKKFFLVS